MPEDIMDYFRPHNDVRFNVLAFLVNMCELTEDCVPGEIFGAVICMNATSKTCSYDVLEQYVGMEGKNYHSGYPAHFVWSALVTNLMYANGSHYALEEFENYCFRTFDTLPEHVALDDTIPHDKAWFFVNAICGLELSREYEHPLALTPDAQSEFDRLDPQIQCDIVRMYTNLRVWVERFGSNHVMTPFYDKRARTSVPYLIKTVRAVYAKVMKFRTTFYTHGFITSSIW